MRIQDYESERIRVRRLLLQAAGYLDIFPEDRRTESEIAAVILIELARRASRYDT